MVLHIGWDSGRLSGGLGRWRAIHQDVGGTKAEGALRDGKLIRRPIRPLNVSYVLGERRLAAEKKGRGPILLRIAEYSDISFL